MTSVQQTVRVKITALLVGTLLAATLVGCGGSDKPEAAPDPTAPPSTLPASVGTVEGKLMMVGGPAGTKPKPIAGKLVITGSESTVHADIGEDGAYAIQLAPGSYRITATSPGFDDGKAICVTEPADTKLLAGKTVTADVVCPVK